MKEPSTLATCLKQAWTQIPHLQTYDSSKLSYVSGYAARFGLKRFDSAPKGPTQASCVAPSTTYLNIMKSYIARQSRVLATSFCSLGFYIPLTTTRRYTVAHFRRFFTVLEYSPIGIKFSPTTAPRTLYTVKKKKFENFQNFFSFESFCKHK